LTPAGAGHAGRDWVMPKGYAGAMMRETVIHSDGQRPGDSPFVGHILLDIPAAEPAFGSKEIAHALAQIIRKSEPLFAVGIFGSWGSGKSTPHGPDRR
jgi:hypothetical protein